MKKRIIAYFLVLVLPILASCANSTETDVGRFLPRVVEVDTPPSFFSVEQLDQELTSYEINGQKIDVAYEKTVYYPVGDKKMHDYAVSGSNGEYLLLNENGTLSTICGYSTCERILGKVSIEQDESVENVRIAVMTAVSQIIKLDNYDKWKLTEKPNGDSGHYIFVFYNEVNGYTCDYVTVILYADGRFLRVTSIDNEIAYMNLNLNINQDWENKLIITKLKDMYNTNDNKYVSHEIHEKRITKYDDEICVLYDISVMETNFGERIDLVIPLSVLVS